MAQQQEEQLRPQVRRRAILALAQQPEVQLELVAQPESNPVVNPAAEQPPAADLARQ
jgi:hypothetical protein